MVTKNFIVDTWHLISEKICACYFRNGTKISKEQRAFYNGGVCGRVNNWLFSYITETNNQPLLKMVWAYKDTYGFESEKIQYKQFIYNLMDGFFVAPFTQMDFITR